MARSLFIVLALGALVQLSRSAPIEDLEIVVAAAEVEPASDSTLKPSDTTSKTESATVSAAQLTESMIGPASDSTLKPSDATSKTESATVSAAQLTESTTVPATDSTSKPSDTTSTIKPVTVPITKLTDATSTFEPTFVPTTQNPTTIEDVSPTKFTPLFAVEEIYKKAKTPTYYGYEIFLEAKKGEGKDCKIYRYVLKVDVKNPEPHGNKNFPDCFSYECVGGELIQEEEPKEIFPSNDEIFPPKAATTKPTSENEEEDDDEKDDKDETDDDEEGKETGEDDEDGEDDF